MSAMTVNTFPSMQSWNSPRAWAMAIIVLLHLGFFWALTNGMTQKITKIFIPQAPVLLPQPDQPKPTKQIVVDDPLIKLQRIDPMPPPIPVPVEPSDRAPIVDLIPTPPNTIIEDGGAWRRRHPSLSSRASIAGAV